MVDPEEETLYLLDCLDLDEHVIDERLLSLMNKKCLSRKNLINALHLFKYKHLINLQDGEECANDIEVDFVVKLLGDLREDDIDVVCNITRTVLMLNVATIISKCEHLLQQILSDIVAPEFNNKSNNMQYYKNLLLKLKICDSILDAVIKYNGRVTLLFVEGSLLNILNCCDEKILSHFLISTVPRFIGGVQGYNILEQIWSCLKIMACNYTVLKVMVNLSEFYLPMPDNAGQALFESNIINETEFWEIILFGMNSNVADIKKVTIYLLKKSIDFIVSKNKDVIVCNKKGCNLFEWSSLKCAMLKGMWDCYFVLIESLEEKQSNIVLPSLHFFQNLNDINDVWIDVALKIGLQHDNNQVKLQCIEYRVKQKVSNSSGMKDLLVTLNDINLYDKQEDVDHIMNCLSVLCEGIESYADLLKIVPQLNWSPVPFYHIIMIIITNFTSEKIASMHQHNYILSICEILKIKCNNLTVRAFVHRSLVEVLRKFTTINFSDFIKILGSLQLETLHKQNSFEYIYLSHQLSLWLREVKFNDTDMFFKYILTTFTSVDIILAIIISLNRKDDYLTEINKKIQKIQETLNRQYCDKIDCYNEYIYLTLFYENKSTYTSDFLNHIYSTIKNVSKTIIQYLTTLLAEDGQITDDMILDLKSCSKLLKDADNKGIQSYVVNLNNSCLLLLSKTNCNLERGVFALHILKQLTNNQFGHFKIKSAQEITDIMSRIENFIDSVATKQSRLMNKFYETYSELLDITIWGEVTNDEIFIKEILKFVDSIVECGSYGCLQPILKVMNKILPTILTQNVKYDIKNFIDKIWKELDELKSTNRYLPCMEQFLKLITNYELLRQSEYNNKIICYCKNILESGSVSPSPVLMLAESIGDKNIQPEIGFIVYILHELLMFSPVPRKDQRILEDTLMNINIQPHERWPPYFFTIQNKAIKILLKITHTEIFKSILLLNKNKIDEMFKNKQRYFGDSQHHKSLLACLQHTLMIMLIRPDSINVDELLKWCLEMLAKLPHQPSIKFCLEWCVALCICMKDQKLNEELSITPVFKSIPQVSQFFIQYLVLKHRIERRTYDMDEYNFVVEFLLCHTMGPLFNTRLHAQYFALKLNKLSTVESTFSSTMKIIERNFEDNKTEKLYLKLCEDYFVNNFDIISHLSPFCIYRFVPEIFGDQCNKCKMTNYDIPEYIQCVRYIKNSKIHSEFINLWLTSHNTESNLQYMIENSVKKAKKDGSDNSERTSENIQKKYIPWKNMSNVGFYEINRKKVNASNLIVVASLIDKLPNLGGLARTSEVFGVNTYIVDSLRHLQDKQFQGLSLSAERWVNIEEVHPGKPLKEYLMKKKDEGYSVVAAEQTSASVPLQTFNFPKKTILLLGHEKNGIPCDMLTLMDHCVEVPQQGLVRSLNVHVTAAIFVWEYTRQHIL